MKSAFLPAEQPLATCSAAHCEDCPAAESVNCHFNGSQLSYFFILMLPPFLIGGAGIAAVNAWWLIPWFLLIVGYFGLIEIRVMCSHCPHYAEPGKTLQCWANYGAPRLWKYRPGPMTRLETGIFFSGLLLIIGLPLVFLLLGMQWLLLVLFVLIVLGDYLTMQRVMCAHCINFACPLNRVSAQDRQVFWRRNPIVDQAWHSKK